MNINYYVEKTLRGHVNVFAFPDLPSICPVLSLKDYLVRTAPLHHADSNKLFISLCKPHKSVSSQTLAWWVTNVMDTAGIDTSVFCQHSTRSALAAWSMARLNAKGRNAKATERQATERQATERQGDRTPRRH